MITSSFRNASLKCLLLFLYFKLPPFNLTGFGIAAHEDNTTWPRR
jgi:hypothetical protein